MTDAVREGEGRDRIEMVLTFRGIREGIRRIAPISLFVVPFGLAFGATAVERGLTTAQAIAMSGVVFAGASQFAALDLWQSPMPYLSIAAVVFAVNARHLIFGAALSPWMNRLPPVRRTIALALVSDANFAESESAFRSGLTDAGIVIGGGLLLWTSWTVGTAIGAFAGAAIGALDRFGIDVVMFAFFAAIVVGGVRARGTVVPVLVASAVAVLTIDVLPTGWNVVFAALVGGVVGALRRAG